MEKRKGILKWWKICRTILDMTTWIWQNLRDQRSRLERTRGISTDRTVLLSTQDQADTEVQGGLSNDTVHSTQGFSEQENQNIGEDVSQNAKSTSATNSYLHFLASQLPMDSRTTIDSSFDEPNSAPGCLPEFVQINKPPIVTWGRGSDGSVITAN